MTYLKAIQYLGSFINYEKIPSYSYKEFLKLGRIKKFLHLVDNPQESLKCIHIAGTKGKGSTCAFIAYILREAGFKVGLYTSPHLSDFRERIRILNPLPAPRSPQPDFEGMVSKNELTDLVSRLKPAIEKYEQISSNGLFSFFEIYTTLAFIYFKEKKVDFAVLETGLGGRLDATNLVKPLVCAITSISYEHTQKLGNTLREIATEKAGIIKGYQDIRISGYQPIVISASQEKEVQDVIRNKCKQVGANLFEVGKDIIYQKTKEGFNVKGIFGEYSALKINLLGEHQLVNATVAVGVIEALRLYNIGVDICSIRGGLKHTVWPGRCEIISRSPLIVLDGAQNVASACALKETIRESFKYKKLILVLGISQDKDIKGICKELGDLTNEVILTQANNPRATPSQILAQYLNGKKVHKTTNVGEAKEFAQRVADKDDLILVTGSLFVVGEFRNESLQSKRYHCRDLYAYR